MQFCKDCGGVLNLFGNNEAELCSSCIQQKKKLVPKPEKTPSNCQDHDLLAKAVLTYENNKIILRAAEGWELWSSPAEVKTELKTILKRATRIYEIRKKRQKN
jgi:hypothetical protein